MWTSPAPRSSCRAPSGYETRLRDGLGPVRERFAYTLLDCPPSLGPVAVNALVAADKVIVPVQAEYLALEGLVQFLDTLKLIRHELNPHLEMAGVLITMHDDRTRLAQDVERELREHLPARVFKTVVPRSVRVAEAPSYGIPVSEHDPRSTGSRAYRALADEVLALQAPNAEVAEWLSAAAAWGGASPRSCRRATPAGRSCASSRSPRSSPTPTSRGPTFDTAALDALAGSIGSVGLLQPLIVRPLDDGRYELVAGERRWRAAQKAGIDRVPAVVRTSPEDERLQAALIENMVREDLNPVEEARACAALVDDLGISKEELARRVGRSRAAISNLIRLLDLPDSALALLERGELSEGHGRAILQVGDQDRRARLAKQAAAEGWSVRDTERRARWRHPPQEGERRPHLGRGARGDDGRRGPARLGARAGRPGPPRRQRSQGRAPLRRPRTSSSRSPSGFGGADAS